MLSTSLRCLSAARCAGHAAASSSSSLAISTRFRRCQSTRVAGNPQLYLHPTSTENRYALSLLSSPPLSEESPTVLGTVEGTNVTPSKFTENPEWRMMMHEILANTVWEDEVLQTQAANRNDGYLHIIDERNLPSLNRAGEPEDIIASVLCENGELVRGKYEPGDAYRLVTTNGPMQLSEGLKKSLLQGLEVARSVEQQMHEQQ